MMMKTPLLECRELTRVYRRRKGPPVRAVDKVDLTVDDRDFLVIVGRSGAGKTTLLNLIGGLERPTSGAVALHGEPFEKMSSKGLAFVRMKKIGFVFQSFNLLPAYTAAENVEIALAPTHLSREERRERVQDLLCAFDLADRADHLPLELSLGQQQKLAIARAFANRPVLIVADEPTGELDPVAAQEVVAKLVELNQEHNVTLVVATHGAFPRAPASRVIFMNEGRIVGQGEAGY
jgi:putative ABC transport system ATP-binding protein